MNTRDVGKVFVCFFACFVVVVTFVSFVLFVLFCFCFLFVFRFYYTSGIHRDKGIILDNRTLISSLFTLGLRREKKTWEKTFSTIWYIHCRYSQSIVTLSFFSERNGPVYPSSNRINGHSPSCESWSFSSEFVAPR